MEFPEKISMKCLFCGSDKFIVDTEKEYTDDDLIECAACNEENLYSSLKEMAVEEVRDIAASEVEKAFSKAFKRWR